MCSLTCSQRPLFVRLLLHLTALVLFSSHVLCALPPGYEDELFCPSSTCLRKKQTVRGLTGPRTSFYECVDVKTLEHVCVPRAWGTKMLQKVKDELVAKGWHRNACSEQTQLRGRETPRCDLK
uniref:Secreted protein n=1 Tax=Hanusia phi TaxID=3032 RepID=A0A7S0HGQ1_9CRYP|mmetsp:Transcript_21555/g.48834  ORF Transcript_21555/g.48834 Transcript_21555/m.48834 type:complete len:123 (+) Transcript_21555:56-424(+)